MKFPCTLKNALIIIRDRFGLSVASKGLCYLVAHFLLLLLLARYKLSCYQTTLLLTISALADITLLKTTCHFLLLLVGLDTLTYRKELQFIPYTCGSSMANKTCGKACTNTLASIKQLAMTGHLYEYIDCGVKWEHLIVGHTHRLSISGVTTFT